jgi:dTMP kinase
MNRGLFITFEGIDGCGKTTQLEAVHSLLKQRGIDCVVTREPGGTVIGRQIRSLLLDPNHTEMCDTCELLLYFADRAQHVREILLPALERGCVVLSDRFADATLAYQGYGRTVSMEMLESQNVLATGGLWPDRTFLFDIRIQTAAQRLLATGKPIDRLEGSGEAFYERVRAGYLELARRFPQRIHVCNGELPKEALTESIIADIMAMLPG